jgi:hypothetical protein
VDEKQRHNLSAEAAQIDLRSVDETDFVLRGWPEDRRGLRRQSQCGCKKQNAASDESHRKLLVSLV